jgi:SPP1 family predicted phage head-tail adaptor
MSGAGDLNKRITIQAPTKVSDGMGGFTNSYTAVASSIPAAIWPVSSADQIQAQATVLVISHRIRIRYRSVLKTSWRISWAGRYFAIVSIIDPNMDHKYLDLLCKEAA